MRLSGESCRIKANSLLESVIALSIISICLYIAAMVYAGIFSPKASPKAFVSGNRMQENFFLLQLGRDSLAEGSEDSQWVFEREIRDNVETILISYKDSLGLVNHKTFYLSK